MQPHNRRPGGTPPSYNPNSFFIQNPSAFPYYQNFHPFLHTNPNNHLFLHSPNTNPNPNNSYASPPPPPHNPITVNIQKSNPSYSAAGLNQNQSGGSSGSGSGSGKNRSGGKVDGKRQSVDRAEAAAVKERRKIVAAGESVSVWKVSEAALLKLQVQSWASLGIQMQDIPTLNQLMAIEEKINTFIHCFVGVRRITSLHDLEMEICKSEGIEHFKELDLGPLLRHPLVVQYFGVKPEVTRIHKITTEQILVCLSAYIDAHPNQKIEVSEFMDFLAKKQSATSKEKLCVRIHNLGLHISIIRDATKTEKSAVKKTVKTLRQTNDNSKPKLHTVSSQKKELDERFHVLSQRVTSFASTFEDLQGKHIRFVSSSSEAEESDDNKTEDGSSSKLLLHRADASDRVGSCPYPSATEEMTRLGMKGESDTSLSDADCNIRVSASASTKKKRKLGSESRGLSNPSKLPKRDDPCSGATKTICGSISREDADKCDHSVDSSVRAFITTWKEACHSQTANEVFDRMLLFYKATPRQRKKLHRMFASNPCSAILHVANRL